ncbi:hypothetical protein [Methylorubrum extorquens]|jgi:hypothetical protein|nr:hypothetical protein [Methylorubrum extorquens]
MLVADYYGQEVHLDGPAWQRNDFAHPEFRLDWTTLEFTHRGMIEATADFFVDLLSTSASNVANHFNAFRRLKTLRAFRLWSHSVILLNGNDLNQSFFYEARDVAKFSRGELSHLQRWYRFCAKREGLGGQPDQRQHRRCDLGRLGPEGCRGTDPRSPRRPAG